MAIARAEEPAWTEVAPRRSAPRFRVRRTDAHTLCDATRISTAARASKTRCNGERASSKARAPARRAPTRSDDNAERTNLRGSRLAENSCVSRAESARESREGRPHPRAPSLTSRPRPVAKREADPRATSTVIGRRPGNARTHGSRLRSTRAPTTVLRSRCADARGGGLFEASSVGAASSSGAALVDRRPRRRTPISACAEAASTYDASTRRGSSGPRREATPVASASASADAARAPPPPPPLLPPPEVWLPPSRRRARRSCSAARIRGSAARAADRPEECELERLDERELGHERGRDHVRDAASDGCSPQLPARAGGRRPRLAMRCAACVAATPSRLMHACSSGAFRRRRALRRARLGEELGADAAMSSITAKAEDHDAAGGPGALLRPAARGRRRAEPAEPGPVGGHREGRVRDAHTHYARRSSRIWGCGPRIRDSRTHSRAPLSHCG